MKIALVKASNRLKYRLKIDLFHFFVFFTQKICRAQKVWSKIG